MSKIVFLDIDGVLNGHDWHEGAQSNTIRQTAIAALNVVLALKPKVVLSSAWRYMIHGKAMKLSGFEYLLRTHGVCGIAGAMIGVTCRDEDCAHCLHKHRRGSSGRWSDEGYFACEACGKESTRGDQITRWIISHANAIDIRSYVVLDDEDFGITEAGHTLVKTNGATGLTMRKAREAVRILHE